MNDVAAHVDSIVSPAMHTTIWYIPVQLIFPSQTTCCIMGQGGIVDLTVFWSDWSLGKGSNQTHMSSQLVLRNFITQAQCDSAVKLCQHIPYGTRG